MVNAQTSCVRTFAAANLDSVRSGQVGEVDHDAQAILIVVGKVAQNLYRIVCDDWVNRKRGRTPI